MLRVSTADLDHILERTPQVWDQLRDGRVFITGGTGFFGTWLLESLCWAVDRLRLPLEAVVLTRSPQSFAEKCPHLAGHAAIHLHQGDVREFVFPDGRFTHVIHAAFPSTKPLVDPRETASLVLRGTEHTLDFVERSGARHLLFTSSGAVYGRQPVDLAAIPETYRGAPDLSDVLTVAHLLASYRDYPESVELNMQGVSACKRLQLDGAAYAKLLGESSEEIAAVQAALGR